MAIEPVPTMTPAPTPGPQRGDESTFDDRMDASIRWFETSPAEFLALGNNVKHNAEEAAASAGSAASAATNAATYRDSALGYRDQAQAQANAASGSAGAANTSAVAAAQSVVDAASAAAAITATSTTNATVSNGSKSFQTQAGKQFVAGMVVAIASAGTPANRMFGSVSSYSGTTLVVSVAIAEGSGSNADWVIAPAGARGPTGSISGGQLGGALDELKGSAPDSSATPAIWSTGGNYVPITSTTAITGFPAAPQAGAFRTLKAEASFTLTNSANLIVAGGTQVVYVGDEVDVRADTTTVFLATVRRANGTATVPTNFRNVEMLSASGTWTAKVTGPHRVTLGGASASGGIAFAINGGAAAASGGGTGGVVLKTFNAVAGDTYTLVMGSRGGQVTLSVSTTSARDGNDAGDSSFSGPGVSIVAGGGKKGRGVALASGNAVAPGGLGGTASGGDFNFSGATAGQASAAATTAAATGGAATPYRGKSYGTGSATADGTATTRCAASGGAGVGGESGNAFASNQNAASSGGGVAGASPAASNAINSTVGRGLQSGLVVTQPLVLVGPGGAAGYSISTSVSVGGGSGAVYSVNENAQSGSAIMAGSGGVAVAINTNGGYNVWSGGADMGGASGGVAAMSLGPASVNAAAGVGGDAFCLIESI